MVVIHKLRCRILQYPLVWSDDYPFSTMRGRVKLSSLALCIEMLLKWCGKRKSSNMDNYLHWLSMQCGRWLGSNQRTYGSPLKYLNHRVVQNAFEKFLCAFIYIRNVYFESFFTILRLLIFCFYAFIQLEENILCLEFRYIDSFDSYGHFSESNKHNDGYFCLLQYVSHIVCF